MASESRGTSGDGGVSEERRDPLLHHVGGTMNWGMEHEAEVNRAAVRVREYEELRDRFACAALTGLLAGGFISPNGSGYELHMAQKAYSMADAMMEAREQGGTPATVPEGAQP